MSDDVAGNVAADTGVQPSAAGLDSTPLADAPTGSLSAITGVDSAHWDTALAYVDYLHTDALLLVVGVWVCAGIMLARLLLDRVVR